jgi:vitamin B12 transporter
MAGKFLPAILFSICIAFPLLSQETVTETEDFFDSDIPFMEEEEGLTITASPETSQQMKIVAKEDIERVHAPDLAALLQNVAGLGVTRYGPYGNETDINMRGFDAGRIAFLIDGIPVNSATTGSLEISALDLNAVERIEVIYGGSDSKYNVTGALGGVINIITVKKQKPGLGAAFSIANTSAMPGEYTERSGGAGGPEYNDLFDTQSASVSLGFGGEEFSARGNIFANRAQNHFLFKDFNEKIRRRDNNEVYDAGASTSLIWDLPDAAQFIVSGDVYYGDKNIPTSGFSSYVGKQTDFSTRQNLMLDMPQAAGEDLGSEASLSHDWKIWTYELTPPASRHDQHTITAINRWNWFFGERLTLRSGGDYRYSYLDSTDMGRRDRHDAGLYLTAEFRLFESLLIIPSIKGVTDSSAIVPVPKFGLVWYAADSLTFKNNYFRSFKFPNFESLYWPGESYAEGNPDLRPEDGWGADFTAAYRFKEWAALETTLFTQQIDDSIQWASGAGGIWRPQNVGKAVFYGWDSKLRFDIPAPEPVPKIGVSFSYQYLISYLLSYGYSYSSDKRIPYMPVHILGVSLDISWETGCLFVSGRYESPRYADTANLNEIETPFLLDIILNQKIGGNLTVFANLRNALNRSYQSHVDYYMPGATLTVGIKAAYDSL